MGRRRRARAAIALPSGAYPTPPSHDLHAAWSAGFRDDLGRFAHATATSPIASAATVALAAAASARDASFATPT